MSAARNFGFVFRERAPNSITIEVMGETEVSFFLLIQFYKTFSVYEY